MRNLRDYGANATTSLYRVSGGFPTLSGMTNILISNLLSKREELNREIGRLRDRIGDIRSDLVAVDRVLKLSGHEIQGRHILQRDTPFGRTYGREIMDILRDAGEPMPMSAIAAKIAEARHLTFETTKMRRKFDERIRGAARLLRDKGWVETVGEGAETKWRIVEEE
jgi:hypothetical protein